MKSGLRTAFFVLCPEIPDRVSNPVRDNIGWIILDG